MKLIGQAHIDGPEARGNAQISRRDDGRAVLTITDYWVAASPDPWIFLSPEAHQRRVAGIHRLGRAPVHVDRYEMVLPMEVDVETIRAIMVYCVQFDAYFGHGIVQPVR